MHSPLNVKLWENTWVADATNKLSLDSQKFQKDEPIAFLHRIPVWHCHTAWIRLSWEKLRSWLYM